MNLLEQYIEEVHNVEFVEKEWGSYVSVELTTNCYGRVQRTKTSFRNMEEWDKAKELGYYMA